MTRTRMLLLLAAAVVLGADAIALLDAAYNRSGAPVETIELTEREVRLERPLPESTALFLRLAWKPERGRSAFEDAPEWFDRAKLEHVGYDCSLPLTDPSAGARYRAMPLKEVFAVLEYTEAAPPGSDTNANDERSSWSRLRPVDAGRDFAALRAQYLETRRFLIVPALVRPVYTVKWDPANRTQSPFLRGAVTELLVGEISVPPSQRSVLGNLGPTTAQYFMAKEARSRGPRYSVVLHYGRSYEPWIASSRRLPAAAGQAQ
jgi:hypothetical protein